MLKENFYKLKKDKQDGIIDAAYSEFLKYDYKKASVKRIAKAANISIGSFYDYFSDKDDLFLHLLDRIFQKKKRLVNQRGFKSSILTTKKILENDDILDEREKGLLRKLDSNNDDIMQKIYFDYAVNHYMDSYMSQLSADREKGILNPHADTELIAYIFSTIEYNILEYCEFKNITNYKDKMKVFNDFWDVMLEGIFTEPTDSIS